MAPRNQRKPTSWAPAVIFTIVFWSASFPWSSQLHSDEKQQATTASGDARAHQVALNVARDRARLMHDVYSATLEVMHRRYFHGDRVTVPARALEDVFSEIKRESKIEARWISVNTRAMSINHRPKTDFEKQAAKKIASGERAVETVEDGYYRRAGAISLGGGCIHCHEGFSVSRSPGVKFAGLVISVPVGDAAAQDTP